MSKFTVRVLTAVITFSIGVALATAWVFNRKEEPAIAPVAISSSGPTLRRSKKQTPYLATQFIIDNFFR